MAILLKNSTLFCINLKSRRIFHYVLEQKVSYSIFACNVVRIMKEKRHTHTSISAPLLLLMKPHIVRVLGPFIISKYFIKSMSVIFDWLRAFFLKKIQICFSQQFEKKEICLFGSVGQNRCHHGRTSSFCSFWHFKNPTSNWKYKTNNKIHW